MILHGSFLGFGKNGILHVCGDDPLPMSMPKKHDIVFSTYVEMILKLILSDVWHLGILHVCGDDP